MKRLARVALAAAVCASLATAETERERESFVIRTTAVVPAKSVEARYFLTGPSGGYSDSRIEVEGRNELWIPLRRDSHVARSVRGFLYAPGCQIELLIAHSVSAVDHYAEYRCDPLPATRLRGVVSGTAKGEVSVSYYPAWAPGFFHMNDGLVEPIYLGTATLDASEFEIEIPDFSRDPVTNSMRNDAALRLILRDAAEKPVGLLIPESSVEYKDVGLRVQRSYPGKVSFRVQPFEPEPEPQAPPQ